MEKETPYIILTNLLISAMENDPKVTPLVTGDIFPMMISEIIYKNLLPMMAAFVEEYGISELSDEDTDELLQQIEVICFTHSLYQLGIFEIYTREEMIPIFQNFLKIAFKEKKCTGESSETRTIHDDGFMDQFKSKFKELLNNSSHYFVTIPLGVSFAILKKEMKTLQYSNRRNGFLFSFKKVKKFVEGFFDGCVCFVGRIDERLIKGCFEATIKLMIEKHDKEIWETVMQKLGNDRSKLNIVYKEDDEFFPDQYDMKSVLWTNGQPPEDCSVCLEDFKMNDTVFETICQHHFHEKCLLQWMKTASTLCPLCRHELKKV